jgi:hypothetical protein
MSHASYLFLLHIGEAAADPMATIDRAQDIRAAAEGAFDSWAEGATDENNWSGHEVLVLRDGRVLQMAPEGDWRGRDKLYEQVCALDPDGDPRSVAERLAQMQRSLGKFAPSTLTSRRWDWAMRLGLDCVVCDLGVFELPRFDVQALLGEPPKALRSEQGALALLELPASEEERLNALSFGDLLAHVHETACQRLSTEYAHVHATQGRRRKPGDHDAWLRDYRRRRLARGYEILRACESTPPFTDDSGVTPYEYRAFDLTETEVADAILITDIHT